MNPFSSFFSRPGETRWGDVLSNRQPGEGKFIFVGVAEDIGIRANGGRPGAALTPLAVFQSLALIPVNKRGNNAQIDAGWLWVNVEDLQAKADHLHYPQDVTALRDLVARVDERVKAALLPLFLSGQVPIVVGGGHNNAFPLLCAVKEALGRPLHVINLDPHPDCRTLEGRHSGNGFSYAHAAGALEKYFVMGLSEYGTNQSSLDMLEQTPGWSFATYESFAIRGETTREHARTQAFDHMQSEPFGLELCADGIAHCPSSAETSMGSDWPFVAQMAYQAGQTGYCAYVHLAEASIGLCPLSQRSSLARAVAYTGIQFIQGLLHQQEER